MTLQRMDNVLIVVDDLEAAKAFFAELGMELEGETTVEGPWVDRTRRHRHDADPGRPRPA
jgi:catechol 2,3-dioxygenase-like lactoylglutathione lyase family enzyme